MTKTEQLNLHNQIAATLGAQQTQELLQKYRDTELNALESMAVTSNDPHGINIHRQLGRVEMLDYLIALGKKHTEPKDKK